jgi:hypothetical protein
MGVMGYSFLQFTEMFKAAKVGSTVPVQRHGHWEFWTKSSANTIHNLHRPALPAPSPIKLHTDFDLSKQAALACWYPSQTAPQPVCFELDCDTGDLRLIYDPEIGPGIPVGVYHGRVRRYYVSSIPSAFQAIEWLGQAAEYAEDVIRGYKLVWNGSNHVGVFDEDARNADTAFELWARELDDGYIEYWDTLDWLEDGGYTEADDHVTVHMPDGDWVIRWDTDYDKLEVLADHILRLAGPYIIIRDLDEQLEAWKLQLREAHAARLKQQ